MLVKLSNHDMHKCKMLGYDTVKLCEMQGFPPRLENKNQTREEANVLGFQAEFAVARLYGIEPPTLNVTSDFGIDLWWDDYSIDVKFSNRHDGDLIFDSLDKFQARIAILVTPSDKENEMNVCGWIGKKAFTNKCHTHNFGYGDRLVVPQKELEPVESLWSAMKTIEMSR